MISVRDIIDIAKPVFGFAFGTKAKAKISMIVLGMLGVTVFAVYITYQYNNMKVIIAEKDAMISAFETSNKILAQNAARNEVLLIEQSNTFAEANIRRAVLEQDLIDTTEAAEDAQDVFDKECGRIERLMQSKASLVVRFANRATERVYDEYKEATATDNN